MIFFKKDSFPNPERKSPFVLPLVTICRPLSPSERKGPLRAFVLHWRDIVSERGRESFRGKGAGDGTPPPIF
jgi:hypothetical protein